MDRENLNNPKEHGNDEIDLVDLFMIVWKRKILIAAITVLAVFAAAGISMFIPEIYEISAIIDPAKDSEGKPVEKPQAIRANIINGAFNAAIAESLKLDQNEIPEFIADIPEETDLLILSTENSDPKQGIDVLNELLIQIETDIQQKMEIQIQDIMRSIKQAQVERDLFDEQTEIIKNKIAETKLTVAQWEKQRNKALAGPKSEAIEVLLYSNEIQDRQAFLNLLQEKLLEYTNQKNWSIQGINKLEIELANIKATNIKKKPTSSQGPVKPNKMLIIALAFVIGLMSSLFLAFVLEFINKVREQNKYRVK